MGSNVADGADLGPTGGATDGPFTEADVSADDTSLAGGFPGCMA